MWGDGHSSVDSSAALDSNPKQATVFVFSICIFEIETVLECQFFGESFG